MGVRRNPYVLFLILLPVSFVPRLFGGFLESWALWLTLWYLIIPLVVSLSLGFKLRDLGLARPSGGWRAFGVLLMLAVVLSFAGIFVPSMRGYYPRFAYSSWWEFGEKEMIMGLVMFAHEAFFRGFLLFPLVRENKELAILAQDIPYTLVHLGKPGVEVPYSFFAGIVFGWLDLKSGSFLLSFLLHWLGSAFFDFLCALVKAGVIPL
ncbi:CAAX protease [Thermococcus profundus]|uniref:CAAX protease n=1 Tax=Thermococcus profundus TaxID=49899 RepID=A0A2Z2MD66_THEPR|nr:CPBP family archaeomyxosortase MrtA [Thermococcus profundus]ASJ02555.1 CAAX protease [Thermococcus profundus]